MIFELTLLSPSEITYNRFQKTHTKLNTTIVIHKTTPKYIKKMSI